MRSRFLPPIARRIAVSMALSFVCIVTASARADDAKPAPGPLRPDRFAIVFNMGYAGDALPQDPAEFEALVRGMKEAHFNVVLCQYERQRAEICKKHGVQIFVDLLAPKHHVYKNVAEAQKLCESLRGDPTIYAYHVWSDNIGETYAGRTRDVKNVHQWDPTHPVYVGTYRMSRVSRVESLDLFGYYDFHWTRGGHWQHLARAADVARAKDARFLRYCDPAVGVIGKGNPNRVGYTFATSIPFGLKGYLFHYAGGIIDPKTGKLDALGEDLKKVNGRFAPIGAEILKLGNPEAVYSTAITVTAKNEPTGVDAAVPDGLSPVPEDFWFRAADGEVLLGLFKDGDGRDVLALAGHNPYKEQQVRLAFPRAVKTIEQFEPEERRWKAMGQDAQDATLTVVEYGVSLVRVSR